MLFPYLTMPQRHDKLPDQTDTDCWTLSP